MTPYPQGVKFITAVRHEKDGKVVYKEQRWSRAEKDYTCWVEATFPKKAQGADALHARAVLKGKEEKGFNQGELLSWRNAFQSWKKKHKSAQAKIARSMRVKHRSARPNYEQNKEVIKPAAREAIEKGLIAEPPQSKKGKKP